MSAARTPVFEVRGLRRTYGEGAAAVHALRGIDLHIDPGELLVLLGPSGSGKSTLIKTVNALEPFQKGEITVDGVPLHDPRTDLPKLRSRVGMVFQSFELFPHLSVTENLTIAQVKVLGRNLDDAKVRGLKMLDRVGLMAHRTSSPASSRADSSSVWRLPAPCRWTRWSCCSMSRPRHSTPKWWARCWT